MSGVAASNELLKAEPCAVHFQTTPIIKRRITAAARPEINHQSRRPSGNFEDRLAPSFAIGRAYHKPRALLRGSVNIHCPTRVITGAGQRRDRPCESIVTIQFGSMEERFVNSDPGTKASTNGGRYARLWRAVLKIDSCRGCTPEACVPTKG